MKMRSVGRIFVWSVLRVKGFWKKLGISVLYAVPVAFLLISYFLITSSGEDIFQGANTRSGALADMGRIFGVNGRLSDMYAWGVIKYMDYQWSFGWDTVVRLLDLAMACGILYALVRLALGRKLVLRLKDALLWNVAAIMLFLTPFGRVLYVGFSLIHNYTIIGLVPILFLWPFYKDMGGRRKHGLLFVIWMFAMGVVFGLSSNLVPLTFLMTLLGVLVWDLVRRNKIDWSKWRKMWRILAIGGVVVGMFVSFVIGPGVESYKNGDYVTTYDYVSFGEILGEPAKNVPRVLKHELWNYGRLALPAIAVLVVAGIFYLICRVAGASKKAVITQRAWRVVTFGVFFAVMYTLTMSQIKYPYRVAFPAYLAVIVVVLVVLSAIMRSVRAGRKLPWVLMVVPIMVVSVALTGLHGYWQTRYRAEMHEVLAEIKDYPGDSRCVERERVKTPTSPTAFLTQEDMLTDWVMPVKIYNKTISFCED